MEPVRVYRQSSLFLILGVVVIGLGILGLVGLPVLGISGIGLVVTALAAVVFILCGAMFLLSWKNSAIITDENGIRSTNLFGKPQIDIAWSAIDRVEMREGVEEQKFYFVHGGAKSMSLSPTLRSFGELQKSIRSKAPQVDYTCWDQK